MKSSRTIALVVLAIVVLIGIAFLFLWHRSASQVTTPSGSGLPVSSSVGAGSQSSGTTETGTLTVLGTNGQSYSVPDFTKGLTGSVLPAGTYYQLTHNQDTEGANAQFEIQYGTDNSIQIVLLKEPLSQARLAAEASLRTFFPLTDAQLCTLNIDLGVPVSINNAYSGKNLGLSFCSGSVQLP